MDASMEDKLRVLHFIPEDAELVLDVGCASGHITKQLAANRRNTHFHGIDVNLPFIGMAQQASAAVPNTPNSSFSHNWLSDLHQYDTKYDAITFMSVLHEFYSSGQGITSVIKALCDAHELLKPGGVLIIRDMLRGAKAVDDVQAIADKIRKVPQSEIYIKDYEEKQQPFDLNSTTLNDFLLHLLYIDNWENEVKERYMFWGVREYLQFGNVALGMEMVGFDAYLLGYVKEQWKRLAWLNEMEMSRLYSTGMVALRK